MDNKILYQYSLAKVSDRAIYGGITGIMINKMFIIMLVCAVPFIILSITRDPLFIIFAGLFGLLSLLGPYAAKLKRSYSVKYYDNDMLSLVSTINFIVNNHTVNLKEISLIRKENPLKAQAIIFKDAAGKTKGRFNHLLMSDIEFNNLLKLIITRNSNIKVSL